MRRGWHPARQAGELVAPELITSLPARSRAIAREAVEPAVTNTCWNPPRKRLLGCQSEWAIKEENNAKQNSEGNTLIFYRKTLLASTDSPDRQSQLSSAQLHQTPSTRTTHASSSTLSSLAFLGVETCKQPYQQWGELLNFVTMGQTQLGQDLLRSIGEID